MNFLDRRGVKAITSHRHTQAKPSGECCSRIYCNSEKLTTKAVFAQNYISLFNGTTNEMSAK